MAPPLVAAAAFGIAYRPMTDADLPFTAALYASTRASEMAATGWPAATQAAFLAQQHRAQHLHYRAANPSAEWLIIEAAGTAVGRLYLGGDSEELRLIEISLLPERRGGGLGAAILRDVQAQARAEGRFVSLHVEPANPARRLYERLGFVAVESRPNAIRMEWRP
jgi:ribosomal protein S18 acetylase RimI-like enzyme